jgi:LmbE family N-acetylglucosaminyl deacetylase
MKLTFAHDRVLAVMAHPDDAELLCAGTLARAKADGAAIAICVMCRGDKGSGSATGVTDLGDIRCAEAQAAAQIVGAELYWHGASDGELFDTCDDRLKLVETFRRFRPTLVITHAPADYHPDHRAASALAEAATWFAASRGHVTAGWEPLAASPSLWWADTIVMSGFQPTIYLNVSEHTELKKRMLACHQSQLQRATDGDFAPLEGLMRRQMELRGAQSGVAAAEGFTPVHTFKRSQAW